MKNTKNMKSSKINSSKSLLLSTLLVLPGACLYAMHGESSATVPQTDLDVELRRVCRYNNTQEKVAELIQNGANVNQADSDSWTPLDIASDYQRLDIMDQLIAAGADVNHVHSRLRTTPLLRATSQGHSTVVDKLLKRGATVDQANDDGRTPLAQAVCHGLYTIAECLLSFGADPNAVDKQGCTVLSLVNGVDMRDLLIRKGADQLKADRFRDYWKINWDEVNARYVLDTEAKGNFNLIKKQEAFDCDFIRKLQNLEHQYGVDFERFILTNDNLAEALHLAAENNKVVFLNRIFLEYPEANLYSLKEEKTAWQHAEELGHQGILEAYKIKNMKELGEDGCSVCASTVEESPLSSDWCSCLVCKCVICTTCHANVLSQPVQRQCCPGCRTKY